jgi:hypothetical protein
VIDGYRITVAIPSGRKASQAILLNHLRRYRNVIDEIQLWHNTHGQPEDDAWLKSLPAAYGGWARLIPRRTDRPVQHPKQLNTGGFYIHTTDPDTIYFRFDDDIVYIHPDYFTNMVRFRLENPEYFLVFGNCWNNAIISYLQQQAGNISREYGDIANFCMDPVAWESPEFACYVHDLLFRKIADNHVPDLFFDRYVLPRGHQFSVSNFCWFGKDFAGFGGEVMAMDTGRMVPSEEEGWLTRIKPVELNRDNAVCGTGFVSHFSFYPQRQTLIERGYLSQYADLAERMLEGRYYQLLGEQSC